MDVLLLGAGPALEQMADVELPLRAVRAEHPLVDRLVERVQEHLVDVSAGVRGEPGQVLDVRAEEVGDERVDELAGGRIVGVDQRSDLGVERVDGRRVEEVLDENGAVGVERDADLVGVVGAAHHGQVGHGPTLEPGQFSVDPLTIGGPLPR